MRQVYERSSKILAGLLVLFSLTQLVYADPVPRMAKRQYVLTMPPMSSYSLPDAGSGVQTRQLGKRFTSVKLPVVGARTQGAPGIEDSELVEWDQVNADCDLIAKSVPYETCEPDFLLQPDVTPNDTYYSHLWGMEKIQAPSVWNDSTGDADIIIAVTDTGVQANHSDLVDNMWINTGETPGNGIDDDGNGFIDDMHGWDFYNNDNSIYDGGDDAHGTHVAGTIAGTGDNSNGVAGVTWQARILSAKFLGPSGGYTSDGIAAINYSVEQGAKIINASWGGGGYSSALAQAIANAGDAGVLFIAAAGNDNVNNDVNPHYPSSYTSSNVIAVIASDAPYKVHFAFSLYKSLSSL